MTKIITGSARGMNLITLPGDDVTRPTSARIKEGMFSALQFEMENKTVLDLFAGSGQLGLEALSRGATSAMFIDASREAMSVVKQNAEKTRLADKAKYLVSDYRTYLGKAKAQYSMVFIDPPYAMASEAIPTALSRLADNKLLTSDAIVVCESGMENPFGDALPAGYRLTKSYRYSISYVHILRFGGESES